MVWLLTFPSRSQGNAKTNDLWSSLSKASGQDVNAFMVSGNPVLNAFFYPSTSDRRFEGSLDS